jgi:hypothetical protein
VRVEKHGLDLLAADLDKAADDIPKKVAKVTGFAMNQIKKDAKQRVDSRGMPHLKHLARSFTYDVTTRRDTVTGEVGAEHERLQGKLDVFIEHGSPTSAPIPHWAPAADKEIPVWKRYLDEVAAEGLE